MRSGRENGISYPTNFGNSGQVLTTNGSGSLVWANPVTPGGDTNDLQFNNGSGGLSGALFVEAAGGYLKLLTGLPTSSTAGGVIIGSKDLAGRIMPAFVGPAGVDATLQPHLGRNRISQILPIAGAATYTVVGQAITTLGTPTARALSTASFFQSLPRVGMVGTATSGSISGWRTTNTQWWRGNTNVTGGFFYSHTFGISNAAAQANGRSFVGLISSTSQPTNVEPTTLANCIGMARLNANTTWGIYGSDATAAGTSGYIDLGANFPANTINTDAYRLTLFAPPGGSYIGYRVERLNVTDANAAPLYVATGTISDTNFLPANTVFLAAQSWVSTGTLTGTAGMDMINFYVESDT